MTSVDALPDDAESLKRLLVEARTAQAAAEAEAARAQAQVSSAEAMIAHYRLAIEKLRRALYGQRSERGERLLGQMELQLEELEVTATEDALAAETAASGAAQADGTTVRSVARRKTGRKPFPEHLPRERVVVPGPTPCACGSDRLAKIGADITETLEVVPRQWKVIQTVREKFTCRACQSIGQAPAPFHVVARGWPAPTCWRWSCSRSTASINRSTARASAMPARASSSACRHWPTRSVPIRWSSSRSTSAAGPCVGRRPAPRR